MHPGEERAGLASDPLLGGGRHLRAGPLGFQHARPRAAALDLIVVEVESARETEPPIEDVGGHEAGVAYPRPFSSVARLGASAGKIERPFKWTP
jgi:hypothetical protein